MADETNMLESFRLNAETVVGLLRHQGAPSDYSLEALQWLDNYLFERQGKLTEQVKDNLTEGIGSFLGECLCRAYNGIWVEVNGDWGVQLEGGTLTSFPFYKVRKFIDGSTTDSLAGFFRLTPMVLKMSKEKNHSKPSSGDGEA